MLACYLVGREGYGAEEAIIETRKRRGDSVGIKEQQTTVHRFEQSIKGKAKE